MQKQQSGRRPVFKKASVKVIATAAAALLIVGALNITTVIAFISELFFVPGIGLTEDMTIKTVYLDGPVEIETDMGTLTLRFMSKVTRNGKNDLIFYIDAPAIISRDLSGLSATVNINGEILEVKCSGGSGGGGDGFAESNYHYIYSDFPDVTEFDFTIRGVTKHISLTVEGDNYVALSKENNGITLALHKFPKVTSIMGLDFIDKNIDKDKYTAMSLSLVPTDQFKLYDENGEEFSIEGFSYSGYVGNIIMGMMGNTSEIKRIKADAVNLHYYHNFMRFGRRDTLGITPDSNAGFDFIEIPIPKDGETIETDCQAAIGKYIYKITEVRREGDMIYYKDNANASFWYDVTYTMSSQEYQKAVENCEYNINFVWLGMEDFAENPVNSNDKIDCNDKTITGFDKDAETLKLAVLNADIIQLGNFDIEFSD
jgi:hypothetical protein